jgi:hypothetical protein
MTSIKNINMIMTDCPALLKNWMGYIIHIRATKLMQVKFLSFGLLTVFLFACDTQAPEEHVKHEPFTLLIQKKSSETPSGGLTTEPFLRGIQREQVQGIPDRSTFFLAERVSKITHYPCGECHTRTVSELKKLGNSYAPKAHWDISLQHASKDLMNCQTCHPNSRMNTLHSLQGAPIEFNHAYQLCGQCHFQQARDWSGGAHGKRLGGWASPRVIKNCTGCHNAHNPRLEKRWPSRASSLPNLTLE